MPIRINERHRARRIQRRHLRRRQRPAHRAQILPQLRLVARADDHRRHARPPQHPVQRHLRHRLAGLGRDRLQRIDDFEQKFVRHLRPFLDHQRTVEPALLGLRLTAPQLPREPPPAQRTPHHRAHALVERQRHQLTLVVPPHERVIGLVRHIPRPPVPLRSGQRLHEVPAREIRAADVADLPRAHELVEHAQRLLDRRQRVEAVQLEQVDVIRPQPPQRRLHRGDQMRPRRAHIVGPRAAAKRRLRGNQHLVAPPLDRRPEDFLRAPARVDIRRVKQREPRLETDIHEPRRLGDLGRAPGFEKIPAPAKRARAEAEHRHLEPRPTEIAIIHKEEVLFEKMTAAAQLRRARTPSCTPVPKNTNRREISPKMRLIVRGALRGFPLF